jgi:hypothetical protein
LKILTLMLLAAVVLAAASIEGTVQDPSGAAVPAAAVTLRSESAQTQTAQTDAQGHFAFPGVARGSYTLTIKHAGFADAVRPVEAGDAGVSVSITLEIATPETTVEVTGQRSALANADPNYQALRGAMPGRSLRVSNLTITRDVGTFHFVSGTFSFLPPVLGKVAAAVFTGQGSFHLEAATPLERGYLRMISGADLVDEPFRSVVIWFTDDTLAEIERQGQPVEPPAAAADAWRECHSRIRRRTELPRSMLEYLLNFEYVKNQEAEALGELYNKNEAGSFTAYIHGNRHSDLRFIINRRGAMPFMPSPEEVALIDFDPEGRQEGIWYLTHYAEEWKTGHPSSTENRHTVQAMHYRVETAIGKNDHLSANCTLRLKALTPGVRVINLGLLPSLRVTRVTYQQHEISFIQEGRKEDGSFYVIMPEPLAQGQTYEIGMEYEGNKVVSKMGPGNFSVQARTSWYPSLNAFADQATYDLTFKVPRQYTLVGVGNLDKEWREGDYAASHWVSEVPLAVAGFNYGSFKKKSISDSTTKYEIESYATSEVPDYLRMAPGNLTPSAMAESAMIDAENSIRCFEAWFGDAPYGRIAITQQPEFDFGQSWPTLVYLPVSAFLDSTQRWMLLGRNTSRFAEFIDEVTPHEVSHQWWGHMVGWASYHDQWLSEGFADFSAGLFLQKTEPKPDKYLKYWEHARERLLDRNNFGFRANDAGPVWMGLRLDTYKTSRAYNAVVYTKGGYVLHMLRALMADRKTGDQDFIDMLHDFVRTYLYKSASTEGFQAIVEKHMKPSMDLAQNGKMDWFFRQWVYGTEVPSYRLDYSLTPEADGKVMLTGKVTQSGVSPGFRMSVPVYLDFDGKLMRIGSSTLQGNETSPEFKLRLPKRPKRVLLNANYDVLAVESVVKGM